MRAWIEIRKILVCGRYQHITTWPQYSEALVKKLGEILQIINRLKKNDNVFGSITPWHSVGIDTSDFYSITVMRDSKVDYCLRDVSRFNGSGIFFQIT